MTTRGWIRLLSSGRVSGPLRTSFEQSVPRVALVWMLPWPAQVVLPQLLQVTARQSASPRGRSGMVALGVVVSSCDRLCPAGRSDAEVTDRGRSWAQLSSVTPAGSASGKAASMWIGSLPARCIRLAATPAR